MLKRILTALVLIPIFVLFLFLLSSKAFCLLTGVVVLWAAFEWSSFMGVKQLKYRIFYSAMLFFLLIGSLWFYIPGVMIASFIWWIFAFILVLFYPKLSQGWRKNITLRGLMGWVILIPCWLAINYIRNIPEIGIYVLLFLFVLIWGADSGAYFAGKYFGKNKLAPHVSPGKTWEGLAGALVVTFIITIATLYWVQASYKVKCFVCMIAFMTVLFSVVGDLFESMLKRNEGLKDSGRLLPGHGGILDRIDSLTAAAPVFLFGINMMQKIFS